MSEQFYNAIGDLTRERDRLRAENERLREALNGLKHLNEDCWCDMAIGHPLVTTHSDACVSAGEAMKGEK